MKNELIVKKIVLDKLDQEVAFFFDRLDAERRMAGKKIVLIKPNIFCREPSETGATTDLRLLGAVIDYFTARDKQVFVGEAGANQFAKTPMFTELGIDRFCSQHQAQFLNLNECAAEPVPLSIKNRRYEFKAPVVLLQSPFLVDLPKFKTHLSTRVSWAIKNLYGLLPDKEKWMGHRIGIHETLLALSERFPVDVVLMDGIVAMKGLGPTMGLPDEKRLLFGARDQFIHDLGLLRLLKIKHVPHIEQCANDQLTEIVYSFLDENGSPTDAKTLGVDMPLPPLIFSHFFVRSNKVFFTLAPYIEKLFDPKIILNVMVNRYLIKFIRFVQRLLKI